MADFDTFASSLRSEFGEQGAGKKFEVFCKWFLQNDPQWSAMVDEVWLWDEYPNKWQNQDLGTDLVFKDKQGNTWAVQAKFYSEHRSTNKSDMNSFLADTARPSVDKRLWFQTTNKMDQKALKTLNGQDKPTTIFSLNDFRNSNINYPSNLSELKQVQPKKKPLPDKHQEEAIEAVVAGLKEYDRGQLIMACGTGKTFTTLWIKEAMEAESTLVLLPSLNLLSQTMREWTWGAKDKFHILNVCSDKSVGRLPEDIETSEASFPVTSDIQEISDFLMNPGKKVLFSTYQSSPLISDAQSCGKIPNFDLAIADEAHRCAGKTDAAFSTILDDNKIRANKRLFTTATPRYFGKSVKSAAKLREVEIVGMDDETIFGPIIHKLTFGEAIQRDLLNDYRVVIVGVDEPKIKMLIDNCKLVSVTPDNHTDAKSLASKLGLLKAIKDYDLKRVISFHNRVKGAKDFSEEFNDAIGLFSAEEKPTGAFCTDYVSGNMKADVRLDKIRKLKNLETFGRGLLANARCLAEGVDVPSLDGIAFIDPKSSQIEIIQAVGRAIRKVRNAKVQVKGTIVIPVFIEHGDDQEASIEASNFKPVWDVIKALRAHDEMLASTLDKCRAELAIRGTSETEEIQNVIFDLPVSVGENFASSLRTVLVEKSTASWEFGFAKLQKYRDETGHTSAPKGYLTHDAFALGNWVSAQRQSKAGGLLSMERQQRLEAINFIWNAIDKKWETGFNNLTKFKQENGHCLVEKEFKTAEKYNLGNWVRSQRKSRKKLSAEQIYRLNELGFVWEVRDSAWEKGFTELLKYKDEHGNAHVKSRFVTVDNFKLGVWCNVQRKNKSSLSLNCLQRLESIGFVWDVRSDQWNKGYQELLKYKNDYGDCFVNSRFKTSDDFDLGGWVRSQRKTKEKLSELQLKYLNDIGFVWDPYQEKWQKGIVEIKKYYADNGDALVRTDFVSSNGFLLGEWVRQTRHQRSSLTAEQIGELDNLGFSWSAIDTKWNLAFMELKKYKAEHGHCAVPKGFVTNDGFKLASWVSYTRSRKDKTTEERIKLLDSIGFVWNFK